MTEISCGGHVESAKLEAVVLGACRDLTAAEARLAEVEAERDGLKKLIGATGAWRQDRDEEVARLRTRLAAVEKLAKSFTQNNILRETILKAARGEGDRG